MMPARKMRKCDRDGFAGLARHQDRLLVAKNQWTRRHSPFPGRLHPRDGDAGQVQRGHTLSGSLERYSRRTLQRACGHVLPDRLVRFRERRKILVYRMSFLQRILALLCRNGGIEHGESPDGVAGSFRCGMIHGDRNVLRNVIVWSDPCHIAVSGVSGLCPFDILLSSRIHISGTVIHVPAVCDRGNSGSGQHSVENLRHLSFWPCRHVSQYDIGTNRPDLFHKLRYGHLHPGIEELPVCGRSPFLGFQNFAAGCDGRRPVVTGRILAEPFPRGIVKAHIFADPFDIELERGIADFFLVPGESEGMVEELPPNGRIREKERIGYLFAVRGHRRRQ